jgi:hypothetical protein
MPELFHHTLSPKLQASYLQFLNTTPPDRLSHDLRDLFIQYMIHHHDDLPNDFHHTLEDLNNLFRLLDRAMIETKGWHEVEELK